MIPTIIERKPRYLYGASFSLNNNIEMRMVNKNMEPEKIGCATARFIFASPEAHNIKLGP